MVCWTNAVCQRYRCKGGSGCGQRGGHLVRAVKDWVPIQRTSIGIERLSIYRLGEVGQPSPNSTEASY